MPRIVQDELLQECAACLKQQLGATVAIPMAPLNPPAEVRVDAELHLALGKGTTRFRFLLQTQKSVSPAQIEALRLQSQLARTHDRNRPLVICAPYLSRRLAQQLREAGVFYLDRAGNAYVKGPPGRPVSVSVEGRPRPSGLGGERHGLFYPAGLKVLFTELVESMRPPVRPTPASPRQRRMMQALRHAAAGMGPRIGYRMTASRSGTGVATVSRALEELVRRGYQQIDSSGRIVLIRRKELLEEWVHGYLDRLRPRLVIGEFMTEEGAELSTLERFRRDFSKAAGPWALGGGFAAEQLGASYRGERLVIHVSAWSSPWPEKLRWHPARAGNLLVLKGIGTSFLAPGAESDPPGAHPLLAYAELLAEGSERSRIAAGELFKTHLEPWVSAHG